MPCLTSLAAGYEPVEPIVDPSGTMIFHSVPATWEAAEEQCLSIGGHLLSVHSAGENVYAMEFALEQFEGIDEPRMWLGGSDFEIEVRLS